jgi:hypothetical protein
MEPCLDPMAMELFQLHPLALQMKLNDSKDDEPTFTDITRMTAEEQVKWVEAMKKELMALIRLQCYKVVSITEAKGHQIVPCTWAFKKKRRPDGSLLKYKARLCVRGDRMLEGL